MTIDNKKKLRSGLVFLASAVALSGCTGTSTYGTGKSQERQLFDDITGIVALGGPKKKQRIDYSARSGLVKPPASSALPAPVESISGKDPNFPENAEGKRARLLAAVADAEANGTELPAEVVEARRQSLISQRRDKAVKSKVPVVYDNDGEPIYSIEQGKIDREAFLKRQAELRGASGAAPRKYLTEPKKIYRTPAQTAPVGVVGEEAKDPASQKKYSSSLWDKITGK